MSRKLVTVRQVSAVNPIPEADAIECISIEGWKLVSQKGNYKVGDLAVYFEIDSFLPDGDVRWQDLVDKSSREFDGKRGHRLRTIKLRGQVSQGFSIPLSKFPEIIAQLRTRGIDVSAIDLPENFEDAVAFLSEANLIEAAKSAREHDFAELLGVVKWDPPLPAELAGLVKGFFPTFIRKTDQERVQNLPEVFDDQDSMYEVTTKLDGSSMTVYIKDHEVGVCSRNLELKIEEGNKDNTLVRTALMSGLLKAIATIGDNFAVQGELMGPGIQGNRENLKQHEFYVFDIFDIDTQEYLPPIQRLQMFGAIKALCDDRIKHAPIAYANFKLSDLPAKTIDAILAHAEGPSINHPIREGYVYKRVDGKSSFKAISNKFLLKEKDA